VGLDALVAAAMRTAACFAPFLRSTVRDALEGWCLLPLEQAGGPRAWGDHIMATRCDRCT
jgi:hypothetical protein